jgi:hypothetical protein
MIKWLRNLFGLCEHDYIHASNIMTMNGPREVLMCKKCHKLSYRYWPKNV